MSSKLCLVEGLDNVSIHNQALISTQVPFSAPSGIPGDLRVNRRLLTTTWVPVPKDKQNGVITGYTVQADSTPIQEIPVEEANTTSIEISNLTHFTSNNFSISAKSKTDSGPVATISSITPEAGEIKLYTPVHHYFFKQPTP